LGKRFTKIFGKGTENMTYKEARKVCFSQVNKQKEIHSNSFPFPKYE